MKKALIIRRWMDNLFCLFLDRKNMKEGLKTILKGIDYIKDGKSIVIFPEGTRNKGEGVQDFHAGSFKFAEKTGCKIIPMVQTNTDCIFERQFPRLKATTPRSPSANRLILILSRRKNVKKLLPIRMMSL